MQYYYQFLSSVLSVFKKNVTANEKINTNGITVDLSAINMVYDLFSDMKGNKSYTDFSNKLDLTLDSKLYQVMFKHYNRPWRPNH